MRPTRRQMLEVLFWLGGIAIGAAALSHFGFVDYSRPAAAWHGNYLIIACLIFWGVCYHRSRRDTPPPETRARLSRLELGALLAAGIGIYCWQLITPPIWSEEYYWAEMARDIIRGSMISPMGFKSDHPANFHAWPPALVLLVTGDPLLATRLPGVIYALSTAYFVHRTVALFVPKNVPWTNVALTLFTSMVFFYARSGWKEIDIIPLLVSAQLFLLARAVLHASDRALVLLALVAGLAFWTLYTPSLLALICVLLVLAARSPLTPRQRAKFAVLFFVVMSPTVGKIINHPHPSIGRHQDFLNGPHAAGKSVGERLAVYRDNLFLAARRLVPYDMANYDGEISKYGLEYTSLALAALGLLLIAVRRPRGTLTVLLLPFFLMLAGIVVSNQGSSIWREYCLIPPLLVMAGIGLQFVLSFDGMRVRGKSLTPAMASLWLALQIGLFFSFNPYAAHHGNLAPWGAVAHVIAREVEATELPKRSLLLLPGMTDGWILNFVRCLLGDRHYYATYDRFSMPEDPPAKFGVVSLSGRPIEPRYDADVRKALADDKRFTFSERHSQSRTIKIELFSVHRAN